MSKVIELIILGKPKSANQLLGQNWYKRKKNADYFKQTVAYQIKVKNLSQKPLWEKCTLSFLVYRSRLMDFDGVVSTLKPIVDGLKGLIIIDDSWHVTGPWNIDQKKCKRGDECVILTITNNN